MMIKLRHLKKMVETGFQHPVTKKYNPYYSILEYPSWWRKSKSSNAVSRMKRVSQKQYNEVCRCEKYHYVNATEESGNLYCLHCLKKPR